MSSSFVFDAVLFFGYMAVLWFREDVFCCSCCLFDCFVLKMQKCCPVLKSLNGVKHV